MNFKLIFCYFLAIIAYKITFLGVLDMLIEFKVKNFRSIQDQQTFSLVAGPGMELEQNTCAAGGDLELKVIRAAVIYGPNAGGKSNLLAALLALKNWVLLSAKESQQGETIPVEGFAYDKKAHKAPSEFELSFIVDNVRYQYGFVADKNIVFEEWLFAYPSGRVQQWFSRVYNEKNKKYSWKFSKLFKIDKKIADRTRPNVLFLSKAVDDNSEQLFPIFSWFKENLICIGPANKTLTEPKNTIDYIKNKDKKRVLEFLKVADPSIVDIFVEKETENLLKSKINLVHSEGVLLNLVDESDGTQRLLKFAATWLEALDKGAVLIADEINNSLHPLLVKFLINLIYDPRNNKKNPQLIFTTHDTALLDNELFRRDQVWFVEKNKNHATQLYSLLDFSPRKQDAIGKNYLQGRYGALPYIGTWGF